MRNILDRYIMFFLSIIDDDIKTYVHNVCLYYTLIILTLIPNILFLPTIYIRHTFFNRRWDQSPYYFLIVQSYLLSAFIYFVIFMVFITVYSSYNWAFDTTMYIMIYLTPFVMYIIVYIIGYIVIYISKCCKFLVKYSDKHCKKL